MGRFYKKKLCSRVTYKKNTTDTNMKNGWKIYIPRLFGLLLVIKSDMKWLCFLYCIFICGMFLYVVLEKGIWRNIRMVYVLHLYALILLSAILVSTYIPHSFYLVIKLPHAPPSIFIIRTSFTTAVISFMKTKLKSGWLRY